MKRLALSISLLLLGSACSGAATAPPLSNPAAVRIPAARAKTIYYAWGRNGAKQLRGYPATASGNVAPSVLVSGTATQLDTPSTIFVADSNALWTCNGFVGKVLRFAPGARGNVAPAAVVAGSNNPIELCRDVTVDNGRFAVTGTGPKDTVLIWAAGSSGNVKPARTITGAATQLNHPAGLAFDAGGDLYVLNHASDGTIAVFARGANGNVAPVRLVAGSNAGLRYPLAIAIDRPRTRVYVAHRGSDGRGAISVFALSADGNVAPLLVIAGAATGLDQPAGVAVDAAGYTYVGNTPASGNGYVTVYAPGASGNAPPVQTIKGPKVDVRGHIAVR